MMAENYSFAQIARLGDFLKEFIKQNKLGFLQSHSFDEEEISKVSRECFRPFFRQQLKEELSKYHYSLTVDSSTVRGKNIFALKARYVVKEKDEDGKLIGLTQIKNKFIGLEAFQETSTGNKMLEIVNSKLFFEEDPLILKNLIGISHDRGSNIIGSEVGLVKRLKDQNKELYSLNDPCHSLNLVLKNSLSKLTPDIKDFVTKIHSYFGSPQRQSYLAKLQLDHKLPIKKLKKFVSTRWLSFGESLQRLIDIWESLLIYMENMETNKVKEKEKNQDEELVNIDYKWFISKLNNHRFYLEMNFLAYLISKLNHFNTTLQNQHLEISHLKILIRECYRTFLKMIVPSIRITELNMDTFLASDWDQSLTRRTWFMNLHQFIEFVSEIPRCSQIKNLGSECQNVFYENFSNFLAKILNLLAKYLPLKDETIDLLDFVDLRGDFVLNEQKILKFNKIFKVITDPEELEALKQELTKLTDLNPTDYRKLAKSSLETWDLIEKDGFKYAPQIARYAQTLPTTSAGIEQTFSIIKLVKGDKRYNLSEANLEGQLFIKDEFQKFQNQEKSILPTLPDEIVRFYYKMKGNLNNRKNGLLQPIVPEVTQGIVKQTQVIDQPEAQVASQIGDQKDEALPQLPIDIEDENDSKKKPDKTRKRREPGPDKGDETERAENLGHILKKSKTKDSNGPSES